jgi:hypothetical protein
VQIVKHPFYRTQVTSGYQKPAEPKKAVPKPVTITNASTTFTHDLPVRSVAVIRLKTR